MGNNPLIRPNGVKFITERTTPELMKKCDPQPGDVVSFKHRGFLLRSQKPRMPTLSRIRTDILWQDVIAKYNQNGNFIPSIFVPFFF